MDLRPLPPVRALPTLGFPALALPAAALPTVALLTLALLTPACGESAADPEAAEPVGPAVRPTQLPVSLYTVDDEPSGALQVQISRTELQLGGERLLELQRGLLVDSDVDGGEVRALRDGIRGASERRVALMIANMVPFETLARVLHTLDEADVHDIHFGVRSTETGSPAKWMPVPGVRVMALDATPEFNGTPLPWNTFAQSWSDLYAACREGQYVDCDGARPTFETGDAYVRLFTSGQAVRVSFLRIPPEGEEVEEEEEVDEEEEADGEGEEAEEPVAQPVGHADFTFRAREAGASDSAITALTRAHCAGSACDVVVEADPTSPSGQIISLLGAAFPQGLSRPEVIFRMPPPR